MIYNKGITDKGKYQEILTRAVREVEGEKRARVLQVIEQLKLNKS